MAVSSQSGLVHHALVNVLEELSQRTRGSGAARLLAVDVVHSGIHPHTERETVVYP
jgi:hypothetical protein